MTKLMEWLAGVSVIIGIWVAILFERMNSAGVDSVWKLKPYPYLTLLWPIGLAAAFALYSIVVIAKRVHDFNDCQEAADELQRQILEAKADLKLKGLDCDS